MQLPQALLSSRIMSVIVARELLANMPDEVFSLYIEPLIQLHGWPFWSLDQPRSSETDDWIRMFDGHSLKTISQLSWERDQMSFSLAVFHPLAQKTIAGLLDQHIHGLSTPYAHVINTKARFDSCHTFIASTGRMPKPVILMEDWHGLRILDGNHRLAAMASFSNADKGVVDCWIGTLYP